MCHGPLTVVNTYVTLPDTNLSPQKSMVGRRSFRLGSPIFGCKLSVFREETTLKLRNYLQAQLLTHLSYSHALLFQARFLRQRETTRDDEHRKTSAIPTRWTRRDDLVNKWNEWQGAPINGLINGYIIGGCLTPKSVEFWKPLVWDPQTNKFQRYFFVFQKVDVLMILSWRILGQGDSF